MFLAGMITGAVLISVVAFGYKFFHDSEKKDGLLANEMGKDFQTEMRLESKKKK